MNDQIEAEYGVLAELFPLLEQLPIVEDYSEINTKYNELSGDNFTTVGSDKNKFVMYEILDEQIEILQRPSEEVESILSEGERTMFELVELGKHDDPSVYTLCVTLPSDRTPPETGVYEELPATKVYYKAKPIDMVHIFSALLENNAWTVFYFDDELYSDKVAGFLEEFCQFNSDGTFNINSINKLQETIAESREQNDF